MQLLIFYFLLDREVCCSNRALANRQLKHNTISKVYCQAFFSKKLNFFKNFLLFLFFLKNSFSQQHSPRTRIYYIYVARARLRNSYYVNIKSKPQKTTCLYHHKKYSLNGSRHKFYNCPYIFSSFVPSKNTSSPYNHVPSCRRNQGTPLRLCKP